jgi:hypothetical protein
MGIFVNTVKFPKKKIPEKVNRWVGVQTIEKWIH